MSNFVTSHPSLFIITAAGLAIIVIFIYWKKKNFGRPERTSFELSSSIELQQMSPSQPDEIDSTDLQSHETRILNTHPKAAFPMSSISESEECTLPSTSKLNNDVANSSSVSPKIDPDVIFRNGNNSSNKNRLSVSDVHKNGSYVSFDDDFNQFDDLSRASNIMRIALDFNKEDGKYVVLTGE